MKDARMSGKAMLSLASTTHVQHIARIIFGLQIPFRAAQTLFTEAKNSQRKAECLFYTQPVTKQLAFRHSIKSQYITQTGLLV